MTGAYVRIRRNGTYQAIEIEHLTDDERERALAELGDDVMPWLHLVCHKLAEVEP